MKGLATKRLFLHPCRKRKGITSFFILPLLFFSINAYSQNTINVKGRITDENGAPVIGASIVVKGATTGVSSDNNGDFEIAASTNSSLIITSVGYIEQEVKVNRNSSVNVTLKRTTTDLNEVVVIGYGTQRKEAITGSVSSISGEKLSEVPSSNISDALQGRLPGVQISQTSTQPGSTMQILIRGQRSISASN
ncbi:MAG TPA: carboxypeptidase-like regulatory domain-containing protein, partial [Hanamia sp.]|nr:carboxypeptidase-like regulatory domain-containing protein [Hanamia sp.]